MDSKTRSRGVMAVNHTYTEQCISLVSRLQVMYFADDVIFFYFLFFEKVFHLPIKEETNIPKLEFVKLKNNYRNQ
jgi:hypothetical protein